MKHSSEAKHFRCNSRGFIDARWSGAPGSGPGQPPFDLIEDAPNQRIAPVTSSGDPDLSIFTASSPWRRKASRVGNRLVAIEMNAKKRPIMNHRPGMRPCSHDEES